MDPNFCLSVFPFAEKSKIKHHIKKLCEAIKVVNISLTQSTSSSSSIKTKNNKKSYIFHNDNETEAAVEDDVNKMINEYIRTVVLTKTDTPTNALEFWKKYEFVFPLLAKLAKKHLSVQESSAAVERMFFICGHIFSLKRRKLGALFFSRLVMLKLNEQFL